jgi:hypothetical protein
LYNHILYFTYWLFNSAVLYVFGLLFTGNVTLGNWRFSPVESAIYAGFWVTFFLWVLWDFALAKKVNFDTGAVTFGYFWAANIFAFWIVSRFSQVGGFGISNFLWAFAIGLAAYMLQRLAWRLVVGRAARQ